MSLLSALFRTNKNAWHKPAPRIKTRLGFNVTTHFTITYEYYSELNIQHKSIFIYQPALFAKHKAIMLNAKYEYSPKGNIHKNNIKKSSIIICEHNYDSKIMWYFYYTTFFRKFNTNLKRCKAFDNSIGLYTLQYLLVMPISLTVQSTCQPFRLSLSLSYMTIRIDF